MAIREATHAGSWYTSNATQLTQQIDAWLAAVTPSSLPDSNNHLPIAGSRVVISPHAGYSYSGPPSAWAYKCLDLSNAKRIFILHPSHHYHLRNAALPTITGGYETPLSPDPLPLDLAMIDQLFKLGNSGTSQPLFARMSQSTDEAEHSCEMQLPYIHRLLQLLYPSRPTSTYPPLVPIMVGNTSPTTEKLLGKVLAPFIADPANCFVLSSDFCHWGTRFGYTYYLPDAPSPPLSSLTLPQGVCEHSNSSSASSKPEQIHVIPTLKTGQDLRANSSRPRNPTIYESIAHADRACMCAIATGKHDEFLRVLNETGNTVCGRHPIGVFMAGVEEWEAQTKSSSNGTSGGGNDGHGGAESELFKRRFRFTRYERSSDAVTMRDSSVSYVSAFAVL